MAIANMWDKDEALATIERVGRSSIRVRDQIQKVAVVAIGYANIHGDITVAQKACEVFQSNKGIRFNSFVKYLESYGQLRWDSKTKTMSYHKREDVASDIPELMAELEGTFWFEAVKAEEAVSMYDVKAAIEKLINKATSEAKKGADIQHKEMLSMLINMVETV